MFAPSGGLDGLRKNSPVTFWMLVVFAASYIISWAGVGQIVALFGFAPQFALSQPWTFVTYPLTSAGGPAILFTLFLLYWIFFMGTTLESQIGSKALLLSFLAFSVAGSIGIFAGAVLTGRETILVGPGLPVAAMTVLWGVRNKTMEVRLWGILPLTGLILAIGTCVITLFGYGAGAPLIGVLALAPLALAWFFAANGIVLGGGGGFARRGGGFTTPGRGAERVSGADAKRKREEWEDFRKKVKDREREREEQERLRKLFEDSLNDDDKRD